jgi:hypothetical protein
MRVYFWRGDKHHDIGQDMAELDDVKCADDSSSSSDTDDTDNSRCDFEPEKANLTNSTSSASMFFAWKRRGCPEAIISRHCVLLCKRIEYLGTRSTHAGQEVCRTKKLLAYVMTELNNVLSKDIQHEQSGLFLPRAYWADDVMHNDDFSILTNWPPDKKNLTQRRRTRKNVKALVNGYKMLEGRHVLLASNLRVVMVRTRASACDMLNWMIANQKSRSASRGGRRQ